MTWTHRPVFVRPNWRPLLLITLLMAAIGLTGCGGGVGSISGEVTYQGKALPNGTVAFYPQGGNNQVIPAPIKNGVYRVENVPAGEAKITVITVDPASLPGAAPAGQAAPGGADAGFPTTPRAKSSSYVALPARYQDANQSKLTLKVVAGEQKHNIPLEP